MVYPLHFAFPRRITNSIKASRAETKRSATPSYRNLIKQIEEALSNVVQSARVGRGYSADHPVAMNILRDTFGVVQDSACTETAYLRIHDTAAYFKVILMIRPKPLLQAIALQKEAVAALDPESFPYLLASTKLDLLCQIEDFRRNAKPDASDRRSSTKASNAKRRRRA
jgi:hypothetical protein